jgi:ubiquinone biosynthesis monooxygenase Coq7
MVRVISWTDRLIAAWDQGLRTLAAGPPSARRPSPAETVADSPLSPSEMGESARLMRVNRAGEISAQALYTGQALFAREHETAEHLAAAAAEEFDHLAWCTDRLRELDGRGSLLDPAWYFGSLTVGALAGMSGDATSLGFVAETERQVESHIDDHLTRLPENDAKSRAILEQMAADEARHGSEASAAGAAAIREPVQSLMALGGELIRRIAYRL